MWTRSILTSCKLMERRLKINTKKHPICLKKHEKLQDKRQNSNWKAT